jgi:hypothetical protein
MQRQEAEIKHIPFNIVCSTKFGRYPKISVEQAFNFIQSDGFMVPFAGYANKLVLQAGARGRDIYSSSRGNIMLAVESNNVYVINFGISKEFVGSLATSSGDVFIAENNAGQIAITDRVNIYIYNYLTGGFTEIAGSTLGFVPGYITFQDSRLIIAAIGTDTWRLSGLNDATSWPNDAQHVGTLQTKPDTVIGVLRFPGRGNLLFVFGHTVTEPWHDEGAALFPYVRDTSFNVDYGCLNANTIAENENICVWLAANEQSGPAIMYSDGSMIKKISTDGIDFKFSQLTAPQDSYGFLFRQDGHQLYMLTFTTDNLSYVYDFNTQKFFTVTDENLNHHIAKRVVFFNNKYYFISFNDGNLYEFGTQYTNFQYSPSDIVEIPRILFLPPLRLPSSRWYIPRSMSFLIENGQPNNIIKTEHFNQPFIGNEITTQNNIIITTQNGIPICMQPNFNRTIVYDASEAVDLSLSRDGGETFGSSWRQNMNPTAIRKSKFQYQRLGIINDLSFQLRFWGFQRFIVGNGEVEMYE